VQDPEIMSELLESLLIAFGLMLIFEGMLPFLAPEQWRMLLQKVSRSPIANIRIIGAASMLFGLLIVILVRN
jgi:uncharacterized protein YjeT (DUF2065 family)